ncbi:MAG: substrate-binding domain-containing protein [Pirellulales bacterium]
MLRFHRQAAATVLLAMAATALSGCGDPDKIVVVSRQNSSGTYEYFREEVLGKDGKFRQGTLDMSGSKDVVELVEKTPGAIGYSGMGYVTEGVKMLHVSKVKGEAGVEPTIPNAKNKSYPLARNLYLYLANEPTGAVKEYIDWILSDEGQKIVADLGYVPQEPKASPAAYPVSNGGEKITINVSGSDTMVNLAQAWSEAYHTKHPNVSVQIAGGGSGTGIAKLMAGNTDICNSSRDMKPDEKAKLNAKNGADPVEYIVGMDALGIYVHKDNKLDSISLDELKEIFGDGGKITLWSQLGATKEESK